MKIEDYKNDPVREYYINNPIVIVPIERKKHFWIQGIGVYVFMDKDKKPLYVGFSKDLNSRINMHFRPSGLMKLMPEADYIEIHFNKDTKFEQFLIKRDKPIHNNTAIVATCNQKTTNEEYVSYNKIS